MKYFLFFFLALIFFIPRCSHAADPALVKAIVQCESSGRPYVWGDDKKSYGIAQFQKATFYEFAFKAKKQMIKHHLWPAVWFNPKHQMFLLKWGLDHGYAKRWTCYRIIKEREIEHRERIEHFRSMYLRSSISIERKFISIWPMDNMDRYAICRNNDYFEWRPQT